MLLAPIRIIHILIVCSVTVSIGAMTGNVSWNIFPLLNQAISSNLTLFQNNVKLDEFRGFPYNESGIKLLPRFNIYTGSTFLKNIETCSLCILREQVKEQNIASLKLHILRRLEMHQPPNITIRPHISEKVIRNFYEKHGYRYIRVNDTNQQNAFSSSEKNFESSYPPFSRGETETSSVYEYFDEYDYFSNNKYDHFNYNGEYYNDRELDDAEDDFYSKINRVYYFPKCEYKYLF